MSRRARSTPFLPLDSEMTRILRARGVAVRYRTTRRLALGCALVTSALVPLAAARLSAAERFPPPPAVSPFAASVIAPPSRVRGTDERRHLVYEIALLNTSASAQRISRVEVLTGGSAAVVASYDGPEAVKEIMSDDVNVFGPIDVLPSSGGGVLWLDVSFERDARIPRRLMHRLTTAPLADDGATTGAATRPTGLASAGPHRSGTAAAAWYARSSPTSWRRTSSG